MEINFGLRPDTVEFHLLVEGDFSVMVLLFETDGDFLTGVFPLSDPKDGLVLFLLALSVRGLGLDLLLLVDVIVLLLDDVPDLELSPKELPIQERRVSTLLGAPVFFFVEVELGDFSVMFRLNSDKSGDLVKLQRPGETERRIGDLEEVEEEDGREEGERRELEGGDGDSSWSEETVKVNSGRPSSSPDTLSFALRLRLLKV